MKRKQLFFLFYTFFIFGNFCYAQFGPQKVITTNAEGAFSIITADIDGDGDLDVISVSSFDDKLAWYENRRDGVGMFGSQRIISTSLPDVKSVCTADFDNDGDIDLIANTGFIGEIKYFRNMNGLGSFSQGVLIINEADGFGSVTAADINGDGNPDLISANNNTGVFWYENDGDANFSEPREIGLNVDRARTVRVADFDSDGDLDVLTNSGNGAIVMSWFENMDGLGNFGTRHIIDLNGQFASDMFIADMDADGDLDVVRSAAFINEIAWFENMDGLGNFETKYIITETQESVNQIYVQDIDNDGLLDVVSGSFIEINSGQLVWYKNLDGVGDFSDKITISTEIKAIWGVHSADSDGDGDIDLLSASQNDDKVAWYENQTILNVPEINNTVITFYPNPVKNNFSISIQNQTVQKCEILNILGQNVKTIYENFDSVNVSDISSGNYFMKIGTDSSNYTVKFIKE